MYKVIIKGKNVGRFFRQYEFDEIEGHNTVIKVKDQEKLFSVMRTIRDCGMELLSVIQD